MNKSVDRASWGSSCPGATAALDAVPEADHTRDHGQFFPGQPWELDNLLPGEKVIIEFTRAQGGLPLPADRAAADRTQGLDWLADYLPTRSHRDQPPRRA